MESQPSCLVNFQIYPFGCLAPARGGTKIDRSANGSDAFFAAHGLSKSRVVIIAVLSFMKKRVRLKPDWCNGRPGLASPIDFLGDDRDRWTVACAFGVTAASCFEMFLELDAVSYKLSNNHWSDDFGNILMAMVYGIVNYPYLACLKAECKIIGYTVGLLYSSMRFTANLLLYFGCTYDKETEHNFKLWNVTYWFYIDFLINIPAVCCTIIIISSYAALLYRELKKTINKEQEEPKLKKLTKEIDNIHVLLLFSNKLHVKLSRDVPWYIYLKNKIYKTRKDFRFSTQFLSTYLVSWILVYQLVFTLIALGDLIIGPFKLNSTFLQYLEVFVVYFRVAVILAMIMILLQLGFFLRNHRNDVLKTYTTRKRLLPGETLQPKLLVGKSLQFCGYQIAFTGMGFCLYVIAMLLILTPIWLLHMLVSLKVITLGQAWILIGKILLWFLPFVVLSILTSLVMYLLSLFAFRDHNSPDISISITNRRLFNMLSYFFFFFNIVVGILSGLMRIVKGSILGLVFFPRLDRSLMMTGYRKWDKGYMAYIGFLNVLVAFKHPVMLCSCQILIDETRETSKGNTFPERPRVSKRALNRWFLAVLLMRNPSLVRYRKQDEQLPCRNDVQLEMPASGAEEDA